MGDINFNITKDVDLNKVVNLDIDKNVDVEVNNEDILATAEADAEAFGERALAETDAYTYVSEGEPQGGRFEPVENGPGQIDILGNVPPFTTVEDNPDNPFPGDGADDIIIINFDGGGTAPPDVDDVNASGVLAALDGVPSGSDEPLPFVDPLTGSALTITNLNLEQIAPAFSIPGGEEALYESVGGDFVVDFGVREVDRNGQGGIEANLGEVGRLTLTVPEGTEFIAEFLEPGGGIEVEFAELTAGDAFFTLTPTDGPDADTEVVFNTDFRFVFESETLGDFGDYAFEAIADFDGWIEIPGGPGTGEAFSYAESTAALDLNGDDSVVPVPTEVL